jgi:hypothetical protein
MRRLLILFFVSVCAGYAYFYNGTGDNQLSRLDPVFTFVEPGFAEYRTFRIDRWLSPTLDFNTGDWARVGDHYYSNKAPGTTLLALPLYELLFRIERGLGIDPFALVPATVNAYLLNLHVSGMPVAIATTLLLAFLLRRRWRTFDALFIATLFAYGSLTFPFATMLWGHSTAAAFLLCATIAICWETRSSTDARGGADPRPFLAGLACGMAFLVDHLAIASLALFGLYTLTLRPERRWRDAVAYVAGILPAITTLAIYNAQLFGSPLTSAPSMSNPIFIDPSRFAGVFGRPSLDVARELLIGVDRGILLYMPVLVLAAYGVFRIARGSERPQTIFFGANAVAYFVLNTMFNGWHGGWSTGPRYLILMLPFCFLLMPPPSELRRSVRAVYVLAALATLLNMSAIASVTPQSAAEANPLFGSIYRDFFSGRLQPCENVIVRLHAVSLAEERRIACFSLGSIIGIRGHAALVPFLILVALPWLAHGSRIPGIVRLRQYRCPLVGRRRVGPRGR